MDSIANAAVVAGQEEIAQSLENNSELLIKANQLRMNAISFLNKVPLTLLEKPGYIDRKIANLKRSISGDNSEISVVQAVNEMRENLIDTIEYAEYTKSKIDFQHKLNEFIGQKVVTKYVYSNMRTGEVTLVEVDSKLALKLDAFRGTMRYTNMDYIKQQRAKTQAQTEDEIQAAKLKETYFEVLRRGRESKRKFAAKKDKGGLGMKNILMIMWYLGEWKWMQVSSEGDINEAYANFYLNKLFSLFNSGIEQNIDTYMMKGVVDVDNVSGLLQGDVNVDNIAYAIKSKGASALGDTDIIATATILSTLPPEQITVELINQIKEGLKPAEPQVRQKLNQSLSAEGDALLQILQQGIATRMTSSGQWN